MEKIITQIAEKFIKKIIENISSGKTLEHLAPILAGNNFIIEKRTQKEDIPLPLKTAEVRARRKAQRGNVGLPNPDSIGHLGVNGKITGTQKILKFYC